MKKHKWEGLTTVLATLSILWTLQTVHSTSYVMVRDDFMVLSSSLVISGSILSSLSSSVVPSNKLRPTTTYEVEVERVLREEGNMLKVKEGRRICVQLPGGVDPTNSSIRLHVSGL
jgi:hypothetical protein